MEDTTKTEKCTYAVKGCKCTGCKDCEENAKKERALYKLKDFSTDDDY
jgi:hypothetical protein